MKSQGHKIRGPCRSRWATTMTLAFSGMSWSCWKAVDDIYHVLKVAVWLPGKEQLMGQPLGRLQQARLERVVAVVEPGPWQQQEGGKWPDPRSVFESIASRSCCQSEWEEKWRRNGRFWT